MLEIRFHGRGGQGTALAAKILAEAVLRSGKGECLAFPEFGVERRGAPVTAYARIAEGKIVVRTRVYEPDAVAVLDEGLASDPAVAKGLKAGGTLLLNRERLPDALARDLARFRVLLIPAGRIARSHGLGSAATPVVNTAVLGALCAALDVADAAALEAAIRESVPAKPEANAAAALEAYGRLAREGAHAAP